MYDVPSVHADAIQGRSLGQIAWQYLKHDKIARVVASAWPLVLVAILVPVILAMRRAGQRA